MCSRTTSSGVRTSMRTWRKRAVVPLGFSCKTTCAQPIGLAVRSVRNPIRAICFSSEARVITFTILGQCVSMKNSKQLFMRGGKPATARSKEAQAYERDTIRQIPASAKQELEGPVRITVHLFYTSERPDLDASLLLDCLATRYTKINGPLISMGGGEYCYGERKRVRLSKGVYENDRQCREIHLYHHIDRANPRAEIVVEPMAMQQVPLITDVPQFADTEAVPF